MPASRFTNPSTGTAYRLVTEPDGWRITKSMEDDGRLRLVHLRGVVGSWSRAAGMPRDCISATKAGSATARTRRSWERPDQRIKFTRAMVKT